MMRASWRRGIAAGLSSVLVASLLVGCTPSFEIKPWAVADHDEKVAYHADAGEKLLNLDATASLTKIESFQATGYMHIESDSHGSAHFEYLTSVEGENYVSRRVSSLEGDSFDQSHQAGSPYTYFLLGDRYKKQLAGGKTWVQLPMGDLDRMRNAESNCTLYSVAYMCFLVKAWNNTKQQDDNVPVQLSRSSNGDQHFATAVSYEALSDVGLIPSDGQFDGFLAEKTRAMKLPLHLWVNSDGAVTKIEVNGTLTGDDGHTLRLQIGFEMTATAPSGSMKPVADDAIPGNDVLRITTRQQLDEFLNRLNSM
ncbi:hypothetical protein [uncultured Gulosibacter sp.]|uniref:hypothetical protein n=1 Tax=uncultured Gulosibacter sp. TaxID=1339167 RepID=UPI00288C0DD6|nr:hypothetical protein [uncultured Gulosibacter sp.]